MACTCLANDKNTTLQYCVSGLQRSAASAPALKLLVLFFYRGVVIDGESVQQRNNVQQIANAEVVPSMRMHGPRSKQT